MNAISILNALLALLLILAVSTLGGYASTQINKRYPNSHPPLLGMMLFSIALRQIPNSPVDFLPESWSSTLRSTALTIILLRAGLGLNVEKLRELAGATVKLSILPNIAEAGTVTCTSVLFLRAYDFPWSFAFCLGFALAAVSPAVVVPSLLDLSSCGYGTSKAIPSLILAAASLDDVYAITFFGISSSIAFDSVGITQGDESASLLWLILRGPLEIIGGFFFGCCGGCVMVLLGRLEINRAESKHYDAPFLVTLIIIGMTLVFASKKINMSGGGYLASMITASISVQRFDSNRLDHISANLQLTWNYFQPMLFGLIGIAIKSSYIKLSQISSVLGIIVCGSVVRFIVAYNSVSGSGFNSKEKLFIATSWIPKATVQAAIGSQILDFARSNDARREIVEWGEIILTACVLAILITAPIGAVGIAVSGPRFLEKAEVEEGGGGRGVADVIEGEDEYEECQQDDVVKTTSDPRH